MLKFPDLIHVEFFSSCSYCEDSITIHIPPEVVVFKTEYYHVTGPKKYVRWDVVGLNAAGTPVFGIEIMHTHATMESPERSTISWVELETGAVIKKLPVLLDKGGELEIANVRRGKATFCSSVCEDTSKYEDEQQDLTAEQQEAEYAIFRELWKQLARDMCLLNSEDKWVLASIAAKRRGQPPGHVSASYDTFLSQKGCIRCGHSHDSKTWAPYCTSCWHAIKNGDDKLESAGQPDLPASLRFCKRQRMNEEPVIDDAQSDVSLVVNPPKDKPVAQPQKPQTNVRPLTPEPQWDNYCGLQKNPPIPWEECFRNQGPVLRMMAEEDAIAAGKRIWKN
jgi:hypothetical protein